jgi:hypothetical protein
MEKSFVNETVGDIFTTLHFLHNLQMDPISKNVTLHQAGKACQGQAFKPFGPFVSYYGKKLENKNLGLN